jgi:hypothetical protein
MQETKGFLNLSSEGFALAPVEMCQISQRDKRRSIHGEVLAGPFFEPQDLGKFSQ